MRTAEPLTTISLSIPLGPFTLNQFFSFNVFAYPYVSLLGSQPAFFFCTTTSSTAAPFRTSSGLPGTFR